jgi:YVTN family beta-propeller protein
MTQKLSSLFAVAGALMICGAVAADAPLQLQPLAAVQIPKSTGKFDFLRVDAKRHRLLAAHENDGTTDVIDLDKNSLITRLKVGGAVDTAIDGDSKRYYISVQEAERVAVLDATTLTEIKSIKMAGPTDAAIFVPKYHRVYVTHDEGNEVWTIDTSTDSVTAAIRIPGVPEFLVYDEAADRIYLNIKTKDLVVVIDPAANVVISQWSTKPASQPHGLAFDAMLHRIYSAGGNGKLVALDSQTGKLVASVDIAAKVDQIALDPAGGVLYCAGAGKMTVLRVSATTLTVLGDLATAETAKNVAVDPATRGVWTTYTDGHDAYAKSWRPPAF